MNFFCLKGLYPKIVRSIALIFGVGIGLLAFSSSPVLSQLKFREPERFFEEGQVQLEQEIDLLPKRQSLTDESLLAIDESLIDSQHIVYVQEWIINEQGDIELLPQAVPQVATEQEPINLIPEFH